MGKDAFFSYQKFNLLISLFVAAKNLKYGTKTDWVTILGYNGSTRKFIEKMISLKILCLKHTILVGGKPIGVFVFSEKTYLEYFENLEMVRRIYYILWRNYTLIVPTLITKEKAEEIERLISSELY